MPKLISVGTCDAPYKLPQRAVKELIFNLFSSYKDIDTMISVFNNSRIENRHFAVPLDWFGKQHAFGERNEIYKEISAGLAKKAINNCIQKQNVNLKDIECIILVSSTGISTPTLDAILFNELKLNNHVVRIPVWGLGCAGGAAGVSRAMDYVKANPSHNCLMVAVEQCSLTFQKDDLSKSNIVASSLFSDGCAAVLVSGNESKYYGCKGIELMDSLSTIYNDSLDVMGWDVVDDGFRVLFSRDIPSIVKDYVKSNIEELLNINGIKLIDINYYVTHPGGMKVINAYRDSLGINENYFKYSFKVLNEHGNMSSPSVLYVLNEFFENNEFESSGYGLLSALGPGFSSELVLFKVP